jgi:hypothetical protein
MTKEEKIKCFETLCDTAKKSASLMMAAFTPPTDEQLIERLKMMPDDEVEGIYRWGSKAGKRLAKTECLRRGIIKKPFWQRAKEYINKLKK